MNKKIEFDAAERERLAVVLGCIGKRIRNCEMYLRKNGFAAFDIVQGMHASLARNSSELETYERFRDERAAEAMGSLKFPGTESLPGDYVQSAFLEELRASAQPVSLAGRLREMMQSDPKRYRELWDTATPRYRTEIYKEAQRFTDLVMSQHGHAAGDVVQLVKLASEAEGMVASSKPKFAECRPIFGIRIDPNYSLIATLVGVASVRDSHEPTLMDWRLALVKPEPQAAFDLRFGSPSDYMRVEIRQAVQGLSVYGVCENPEQIALITSLYSTLCRWLCKELQEEISALGVETS